MAGQVLIILTGIAGSAKTSVARTVQERAVLRGSVITARGPAGEPYIAATYRHGIGDYLRAALSLDLQVGGARSRVAVPSTSRPRDPAIEIGDWQHWPWSVMLTA